MKRHRDSDKFRSALRERTDTVEVKQRFVFRVCKCTDLKEDPQCEDECYALDHKKLCNVMGFCKRTPLYVDGPMPVYNKGPDCTPFLRRIIEPMPQEENLGLLASVQNPVHLVLSSMVPVVYLPVHKDTPNTLFISQLENT